MKVIAIGRPQFTLGFSLVGLETYNYGSHQIKEMPKADLGVIIIEKQAFDSFDEIDRKDFEGMVQPLFVVLSESDEQQDLGKLIKRSIGIEL